MVPPIVDDWRISLNQRELFALLNRCVEKRIITLAGKLVLWVEVE